MTVYDNWPFSLIDDKNFRHGVREIVKIHAANAIVNFESRKCLRKEVVNVSKDESEMQALLSEILTLMI